MVEMKDSRIKKGCRICFIFDGWTQNKTETKIHENYTAVTEKEALAKQFFVVPKRAEKLELICKNDEGRMKST